MSQPFDHRSFLNTVTERPGVYQMLDGEGEVLYVGKARNLRQRLASYFRSSGLSLKTKALVERIRQIQVTVTRTETEALILEHNLIKQQRPPYNILLRDDKSYPYILLTDAPYPRLVLHRGARREAGRYFGPYPNASAARESLNFLQKVFRVRQCDDSFFRNRSRPCLQYQIGRCTAPCVGLIDEESYAEDVRHSEMFLSGQSSDLVAELADRMEAAAAALEFEQAAALRDQIQHLQQVQSRQYVEGERGDVDVIACSQGSGVSCVQQLLVRDGRVLGSRAFYPRPRLEEDDGEVLEAFVLQHYLGANGQELPAEILVSAPLPDADIVAGALMTSRGGRVRIQHRCKGARAQWLELARRTAEQNRMGRLASRQSLNQRFEALQRALDLPEIPERVECFDISHTGGESTVASCVVFDRDGPRKSDYRRFNIEGITPGDDYAAMGQALSRRYARLRRGEGVLPDLLLIDGGKGQLGQAVAVLGELGLDSIRVMAVAEGSRRRPGRETLLVGAEGRELALPGESAALHLIQQIRDEAHRFAVTGHKQRRDRARRESRLESIPGIGPRRRRELLRHFGGLQEVARASVEDLCRVPGISHRLAADIHAALQRD